MIFLTAALVMASLGVPTDGVPLPPPKPQISQSEDKALALPPVAVESEHGPPTECDRRLAAMAVFTLKPTMTGPGACGGGDLVEVTGVLLADGSRVAVQPKATLRCEMAESFAAWVRDEVAPRLKPLNAALHAVETADSYDCRGRNRVIGAKVSEHGKGNAVDVRGFILADRRKVVLTDAAEPKDMREAMRDSACHRFTTVLGPGSDGYHEEHIHLDVLERRTGYRICQWAVREPRPVLAAAAGSDPVPLPPPRPPVPGTRKL
jgi:hypothetical protein